MNSFYYLLKLIKGRSVLQTKTISQTHFSFIIFLLSDLSTIVVVRERDMISGKVCSRGVVDIKEVSTNLVTTAQMIRNNTFIYSKEKTNDWNVIEAISTDKAYKETTQTRCSSK